MLCLFDVTLLFSLVFIPFLKAADKKTGRILKLVSGLCVSVFVSRFLFSSFVSFLCVVVSYFTLFLIKELYRVLEKNEFVVVSIDQNGEYITVSDAKECKRIKNDENIKVTAGEIIRIKRKYN